MEGWGREEEPSRRWTMPAEQAPEFNRYINLMNGVNERLQPLALILWLEVDKLHLRLGILATFTLWNIQALCVDEYVRYGTKRRSGACPSELASRATWPLRRLVP